MLITHDAGLMKRKKTRSKKPPFINEQRKVIQVSKYVHQQNRKNSVFLIRH